MRAVQAKRWPAAMTHYKTLIDTVWLGQWDLPARDAVVTIAKVERFRPEVERKKKMPDGTYAPEPNKRLALSFVGKRKQWLAGPVSQQTIAGMYGPQIEAWIGKRISLYVDPNIKMGRVVTGGVRVRPTPPSGGATEDALDRPVDETVAEKIEQARADVAMREPGED